MQHLFIKFVKKFYSFIDYTFFDKNRKNVDSLLPIFVLIAVKCGIIGLTICRKVVNGMPMDAERHEEIMNLLYDSETTVEKRTELLGELREANKNDWTEYTEITTERDKFKNDNLDLVQTNSKLFRQAGMQNEEQLQKQNEEEFSQTVNVATLLENANKSIQE